MYVDLSLLLNINWSTTTLSYYVYVGDKYKLECVIKYEMTNTQCNILLCMCKMYSRLLEWSENLAPFTFRTFLHTETMSRKTTLMAMKAMKKAISH